MRLSGDEASAMTTTASSKTFSFQFIQSGTGVQLELWNATEQILKSIEVLTVFLKDDETGGPSRAHIRFEAVNTILPREKALLSHRTWINGKPSGAEQDQMARLTIVDGQRNPYVLDISWQDQEGKTRFQRIPVGH